MWTVIISIVALYWAFVLLVVLACTLSTLFKLFIDLIRGKKDSRQWYAKTHQCYYSIYNYRKTHGEAYTAIDALADYKVIFRAIVWFSKPYRFVALVVCLLTFLLAYPVLAVWRWLDFIFLATRVARCIAQAGSLEFIAQVHCSDYTFYSFLAFIKSNVRVSSIKRVRAALFILYKPHRNLSPRVLLRITWEVTYVIFLGKPLWVWEMFFNTVIDIVIKSIDDIRYSKLHKIFRIRMRIHYKTCLFNSICYGQQILARSRQGIGLSTARSLKILNGRPLI